MCHVKQLQSQLKRSRRFLDCSATMALSIVSFLGLLSLSRLHLVTGQRLNCRALNVYDGQTRLLGFPCVLYGTQNCSGGPGTFPQELRDGHHVGEPGNFTATVYRRKITHPRNGHLYLASGINYTWVGPRSGGSREGIKGFYLYVLPQGSGHTRCRLIDLRGFDLNRASLRFHFEMFPFTETTRLTYQVQLRTLPPPTENTYDASALRHVLSVPALCDYNETSPTMPNAWTTAIWARLDPAGGSVEVSFSFPEEGSLARFDTYEVALLKNGSHNLAFTGYVTDDGNDGNFGSYAFQNVPQGVYQIVITPNDTYRYNNDKCLCYEVAEPPLPRRLCQSSCASTRTEYFQILAMKQTTGLVKRHSSEGPAASYSVPGSTSVVDPDPAPGRARCAGADGGVVAAAVVVSLAASFWIATGA